MRLRRKMEYSVDLVLPQTSQHISWFRQLAVEELEIRPICKHPRIVQRAAIVKLVKADYVVGVRVLGNKVANEPGSALGVLAGMLSRFRRQNTSAYIKPSPPVTMMFRTSGNGSNEVCPVSIGAPFQMPSSAKKRASRLPTAAVSGIHDNNRLTMRKLTTCSPGSICRHCVEMLNEGHNCKCECAYSIV